MSQISSFASRSVTFVIAPFFLGRLVKKLLWVELFQEDATVALHYFEAAISVIQQVWYRTMAYLSEEFLSWRIGGAIVLEKLKETGVRTLGSISAQIQKLSFEIDIPISMRVWEVLGVSVAVLLWYHRKRRTNNNMMQLLPLGISGDDGMEILRTTRDRSSTFDFFGTHAGALQHPQQQSRDRSSSLSSHGEAVGDTYRRERMGSMDLYYSQRYKNEAKQDPPTRKMPLSSPCKADIPITSDFTKQQTSLLDGADDEGYLFDEFGLVTLSYEMKYYGPLQTSLRYETWTPPTSWAEVSRRIVPQDIMLKLKRSLNIEMKNGTLSTQEPKSGRQAETSMPISEFSVHVQQPVEGGVLSLYVKGTAKEEWMEHTFESAQLAAQFQLDLLAYQVLGRTVFNLFEALSLVHAGSMACERSEFVLHHASPSSQENEEGAQSLHINTAAVAWDDAMRALSSIPTIRIALERLWLHHHRPVIEKFSKNKKRNVKVAIPGDAEVPSQTNLLTDEYAGKRLLLGPVDFFRLFVPALPETAIPEYQSHSGRMEQLLSWRKRAARASILVRSYVSARTIANIGWEVGPKDDEASPTLRRRLAYDDNDENNRRDMAGRNEIYEASVSRDVLCHVRPFDYFSQSEDRRKRKNRLVLSPYQAYTLVGAHVFRTSIGDEKNFPLHPSRDPVEVIPSLRKLIQDNPDVDFLVTGYHRVDSLSIIVHARSLAKDIDPQFENIMTRFAKGDADVRKRKLHMMIQMGHSQKLSFLGVILVRFLSFLFSLTRKGRESPLALEARRDRIPFPAIRLASYGETYHFGGALRKSSMPSNYLGMNTFFEPRSTPNLISRVLFSYLDGQLTNRVLDFTLVLEGENQDELPERALCTTRVVHMDAMAVAKDTALFRFDNQALTLRLDDDDDESSELWPRRLVNEFASVVRSSFMTPKKSTTTRPERMISNVPESPSRKYFKATRKKTLLEDSMGAAEREVAAFLEGIQVPVRIDVVKTTFSRTAYSPNEDGGLPENTLMTSVFSLFKPHDIRRFLIASALNPEEAAIRLVKTAAWRGQLLPVDKRMCRVELQSGQVFQQGHTRSGNPVLYFRTTCRGPWRNNPRATLSAALCRLESAVSEYCSKNQDTQLTLVVLLGLAANQGSSVQANQGRSTQGSHSVSTQGTKEADDLGSDESDNHEDEDNDSIEPDPLSVVPEENVGSSRSVANPRVSEKESWQLHCTKALLEHFITILFVHYPEQFSQIIFVKGSPGGRKNMIYRTHVAASRGMKRAIPSSKDRTKVRYLLSAPRLRECIDDSELSVLAGGKVPVPAFAFEC